MQVASVQFRMDCEIVLLPCTTGLLQLCLALITQVEYILGFSIGIVRKHELPLFRTTRVDQKRCVSACVGVAGKMQRLFLGSGTTPIDKLDNNTHTKE